MIEYNATLMMNTDGLFGRLNDIQLALAVEAEARKHLNEMKHYELDAPAPGTPSHNPFRNRLRRITGQLADTAFIRSERNGLRRVLVFPAEYAAHHDARMNPGPLGERDVFRKSFARRERDIKRGFRRSVDQMLRG